jgi:elongation factor 1-beta
MGKVAITFRIMPEGIEVDLKAVESGVRSSLGGSLKKLEVKPVAFGLNAVEAIVVVDDAGGEMERLEEALRGIPGVGGVEATEVTLL